MGLTFYGDWFVEVIGVDSAFSQRFVISGSDLADGAYDGVDGISARVSGEAWTIDLEWNDNASSGWQPSDVQKTATYTIDVGLVVTLGADDNVEELQDRDFNDMVVACTSLDPTVNPPMTDPPLDFTITEDQLRPPDPRDSE